MHYTYRDLYAAKVLEHVPCSPYGQVNYRRNCCNDYPVQRPLTLLWVMLSHGVFAYYGLIRDSRPFRCLIFFVQRIFAVLPRMSWCREFPQFTPHIFSIVPFPVPRRSKRLHSTVTSPFTLAFALFGKAQLAYPKPAGSHLGRLTRLQISLYATARWIACPSPARTFTFELSSLESPRSDVEYNYTDKQSISVTGLSPVRYAALWAATERVGRMQKLEFASSRFIFWGITWLVFVQGLSF